MCSYQSGGYSFQMTLKNIVVGFDLQGWFPKLFDKYRPKDMDYNTYVKVIVESYLVDRSLKDEHQIIVEKES